MSKRRLSFCPEIECLKKEADELLAGYRRKEQEALDDFKAFHPSKV